MLQTIAEGLGVPYEGLLGKASSLELGLFQHTLSAEEQAVMALFEGVSVTVTVNPPSHLAALLHWRVLSALLAATPPETHEAVWKGDITGQTPEEESSRVVVPVEDVTTPPAVNYYETSEESSWVE